MPRWVQQGRSSRWVESPGDIPLDHDNGPTGELPAVGTPARIERDFQVVIRELGDRVSEAEARRVFDSNEHDIVNTILELQDYNPQPLPLAPPAALPTEILISTPGSLLLSQWSSIVGAGDVPPERLSPLTLSDGDEDGEEDHNNDGENNPTPPYTGTRLSAERRYTMPVDDIVVVQAPSAPGERPVRRMMRIENVSPLRQVPGMVAPPEPEQDQTTEPHQATVDTITTAMSDLSQWLNIDTVRAVEWEDPQRTHTTEPMPLMRSANVLMRNRTDAFVVRESWEREVEATYAHHLRKQKAIQEMDEPKPATELHGLIAEALDKWDRVRNGWAKDYPHEFMCALSLHIMRDPVCCADGYTYERAHIEHHIRTKNTSPRTMLPLSHQQVFPSVTMRQLMEHWVEKALHVPKDTTLEGFLRQRLESIKKAKEQTETAETAETCV